MAGEATQYIFEVRRPDGTTYTSSAVGSTEDEARATVASTAELLDGPDAVVLDVVQTYETAALPTVTVNGKQVLDPVGLAEYQDALSKGASNIDAIMSAQDAALQERGVINVTPSPQDSLVDLTPAEHAEESAAAGVTTAGVSGAGLPLLLGIGALLFLTRRK